MTLEKIRSIVPRISQKRNEAIGERSKVSSLRYVKTDWVLSVLLTADPTGTASAEPVTVLEHFAITEVEQTVTKVLSRHFIPGLLTTNMDTTRPTLGRGSSHFVRTEIASRGTRVIQQPARADTGEAGEVPT